MSSALSNCPAAGASAGATGRPGQRAGRQLHAAGVEPEGHHVPAEPRGEGRRSRLPGWHRAGTHRSRDGPQRRAGVRPPELTRMPFTTVMFSFSSASKVTRRVLALPPMAPACRSADSRPAHQRCHSPRRARTCRDPSGRAGCQAATPGKEKAPRPASSGHAPRRLARSGRTLGWPASGRPGRSSWLARAGCYGNRESLTGFPELWVKWEL